MRGSKTKQLRAMLNGQELSFFMEVHNGLSAKIVQEVGFKGLWGSGLSLSAAMGVRDNNELSWTQVLDLTEFITHTTSVPLLLDGDTGHGNFNNMRRLVAKLETRDISGVCIEDKLFPKTNSFIGDNQPLADIDEFCGKIKAGKDAQTDDDFVIVARVEAFIAGWGLSEALKRAEAYRRAGADAILIHSKLSKPDEVLAFKKEWGDRLPVLIVPTRYFATPTEVFRQAGFRIVIWANHMMRTAATAMRQTAVQVRDEQSLVNVEGRIIGVNEVFRLQNAEELEQAEKRYLPGKDEAPNVVILAASRGHEFGALTEDRPKAMIPIVGRPLLERLIDTFRSIGVRDITVVRGYKKETIAFPNVTYVDNDDFESTNEGYSCALGVLGMKDCSVLVAFGDVLFQKYIPMHLFESDSDFCIAVDADWHDSPNKGRHLDAVRCDRPYTWERFDERVRLVQMVQGDASGVHGEWIGLLKVSKDGLGYLNTLLAEFERLGRLKPLRMSDLLNALVERGKTVEVIYARGHWLDLDTMVDLADVAVIACAPDAT